MTKALAFTTFVSCCVTAFCLGMLTYTLEMGKLPFKIPMKIPSPEKQEKKEEESSVRKGEIYAEQLYEQLNAERQKVIGKTTELEERERHVNEISNNVKELQNKLAASQKETENLMIKIDKAEKENIRRVVQIVEGLETKAAGKMLIQMMATEPRMVPRIFYYMKKDKASEILSNIIDTMDKKKLEEAVKVAMEMQRIEETGK